MFGALLDRLTAVVGIRRVRAYESAFAERDGTNRTKGEAARTAGAHAGACGVGEGREVMSSGERHSWAGQGSPTARSGMAGRGWAGPGQARLGMASLLGARRDLAGRGPAWRGQARHGAARQCRARRDRAGRGKTPHLARRGRVRLGRAVARLGMARLPEAARRGMAWLVTAWLGQSRPGRAWRGKAKPTLSAVTSRRSQHTLWDETRP